ncbi:MAG: hypothetical protein ACOX1F_02250 [Erysipelotrichaceae bacterium]|jgi:hypothetical protein
MKFIHKILLMAIILIVLLSGCFNNRENKGFNQQNISSEKEVIDFINNFSGNHPDYDFLDYIVAAEDNSPIKAVIVASNREKSSSFTLFFLFDHDDWGEVSFGEDNAAYYRKKDGLRLEKNIVTFSFDYESSSGEYEIHDFEITVSRINDSEPLGINYTSNETIRQNTGQ